MKYRNTGKVVVATLLTTLTAGNALAEWDYHETHGYEDELARCVDLIRPVIGLENTDKVTYDVQEIDLHGPWYKFEISTTIVDDDGTTQIDSFNVGCKSNRRISATELLDRTNTARTDQAVLARNQAQQTPEAIVLARNITNR